MKKALYIIAAASLMVACDPVEEGGSFTPTAVVDSQLSQQGFFTFTQTDAAGNVAADGNFFTYTTNPSTIVRVFNYKADGSENQLALGSSGTFAIQPSRGSDPNQKFFVQVVNSDLSKAQAEYSATVFVKQELSVSEKLMASNSGKKTWKWDPSITGAVWGNMGYQPGDGASVGISGNGQWWGVTTSEEFDGQLNHTPNGVNEGDGNLDAYMVFNEDGLSTCYDASGNVIRTGDYTFSNYDPSGSWKVGDLKTDAILWPYIINNNGLLPSQATWGTGAYEVVYLTVDKMTLVYPGQTGGVVNGSWGEATFWHFTSNSDLEGLIAGVEAGKDWTWDNSITGAVWGNMGYQPGDGASVGTSGNGQWWGVTTSEEFDGQLNHTASGVNEGDGNLDAWMTFGTNGEVTSYKADGSVIRKGEYKLTPIEGDSWKVGELKTDAILWPYIINNNGMIPSEATWGPGAYEIVYLTGDKMTLCYPGQTGGVVNGSWGEATFWHFKAK